METRTSAPVLWYGDYVDFGSFKSAVHNGDMSKAIGFEFQIEDFEGDAPIEAAARRNFLFQRTRDKVTERQVNLEYTVTSLRNTTVRNEINLYVKSLDTNLRIQFDPETNDEPTSIYVDDYCISDDMPNILPILPKSDLFGEMAFLQRKSEQKRGYTLVSSQSICQNLISLKLKELVGNKLQRKSINHEARTLLKYNDFTNKELASRSEYSLVTFQKLYKKMSDGEYPDAVRFIKTVCNFKYLLEVLHTVSDQLQDHFSCVEYIGPARARSERYYRHQELQVTDISSDGNNLPIFLASLSDHELKNFSDWVKSTFDYGVKVEKTVGHISITLVQAGEESNIVDTGYGVSQVLPVLAQIWWMQSYGYEARAGAAKSKGSVNTLAIEQPELHLHPAHQAMLADVFSEAISKNGFSDRSISLIVETHSEALINRIGELIEKGNLKFSDVQIIIFGDESDPDDKSYIRTAEFDELGRLQNWPFGFFNYS